MSPIRQDPLYRFSRRIAAVLNPPVPPGPANSLSLEFLLSCGQELQRIHRLFRTARHWGWSLSAERLAQRLPAALRRMGELLPAALAEMQAPTLALPVTVQSIYLELLALQEEFGSLHLDGRQGVIGAVTEPLELEGVPLGPFRIELHLVRLCPSQLPAAIRVIALQPNPAACSEGTVHPHVRDGLPCLGEATAAVGAALRDGRLLDAFLAVTGVLRSYNPHSPYVALDEWDGRSCDDCGRHRSQDDIDHCNSCGGGFCSGCSSCCETCDSTFCLGCLARGTDDENLCSGCRGACSECGDVTAQRQLDEHDGRCRQCAGAEDEAPEEADGVDGPEAVPADCVPPDAITGVISHVPFTLEPEN